MEAHDKGSRDGLAQTESQILIYQTPGGQTRLEVRLQDESVWLTQRLMAQLFQTTQQNISLHISRIYEEYELSPEGTHKKYLSVQQEGTRNVRRQRDFYNLDMIISVGYRVKSGIATQFRQWATQRLKEYVIKGFVLDDERLKLNKRFGRDYFDELLERIREIRASERRFYQKVTDIYEQCSIDYNKDAEITQTFFKTVQNKLHWAITGKTAAELIAERADASKPHMGLMTWKNAPRGKILKSDVTIAKNYLHEDEVKHLERIVSMYLDYAENQAARQIPMKMQDWIDRLDAFLKFNEYEILTNAGKVSSEVAKQLAAEHYEKFRIEQDRLFESDFDREVKRITQRGDDTEKDRHGKES